MIRERTVALVLVAGLALAACGGGGSATSAPGQTAGSGATTAPQPTGAGAGTEPPEATEAPTATTGGGSSSADACDLLTADEVEQATGYTDVEVQVVDPSSTDALSGCSWIFQGVLPITIVTVLDPSNTNTDPSGYLALPGSEEVQLSGARGVFAPAAGNILFVFKGGTVATVLATPQTGDVKAAATPLAQKVADRL